MSAPTGFLTMADVAGRLDLHPVTVSLLAREHGIGVNYGGRAGWRFTEDDVQALLECRRVKKSPVPEQRRRRRRERRTADGRAAS